MKQKPVIIRMSGGLANRMFQYTYYVFLRKNGIIAFVDYYNHISWEHEKVSWEKIFPKAYLDQAPDKLIFRYGGSHDFLSKIRRHYLGFLNDVYFCPNAFTLPSCEDLEKKHYIIGICHHAKMVESVRDEMIDILQFESFVDIHNKILQRKIMDCNSIAVHVRKGKDYFEFSAFQTCDVDYYKNAINLIKKQVDNPIFFVFTDNTEWVKDNFTFFDYELVNHNPAVGWGNHFDMQLMSNCKHNIIANSTYSWWGAFLNQNPSKIVIAPKKWFNSDDAVLNLNSDMAYCSNWTLL